MVTSLVVRLFSEFKANRVVLDADFLIATMDGAAYQKARLRGYGQSKSGHWDHVAREIARRATAGERRRAA